MHQGDTTKSLLADAGPEDGTIEQNVSRLAIDFGAIEAVVLSHECR